MDMMSGPPCDEDVWELIMKRDMAVDFLLPGRAARAIPGEPGHFTYRSPACEAVAEFIWSLDPEGFGSSSDMVWLGLMFLRQWAADHQVPSSPLLRRAFLLLVAVLRAVSCAPGRLSHLPGDAVVRVPSAALVRARTVLTAAPPYSRAPVLAGAAA